MQVVKLGVEVRETTGSAESRRVRRAGRIPVVLYGLGQPSMSLSVEAHPFKLAFERGRRMFELNGLKGGTAICILKDVAYNALGDHILHLDLLRVDEKVPVTVKVPIEFVGHPETPSGATVDYIRADISVSCVPRLIPEKIEAKISGLAVGTRLTAAELPLPEGVTLVERPGATIVTHHYKHAAPEAEPAADAPAAGAPATPAKPS